MSSSTVDLVEFVQPAGPLTVNRTDGYIGNVRVLGLQSANNRTYERKAVQEAIGLYEGRQVNVNHPAKPSDTRSAYDRFGWLEGVRQDADGGLSARKLNYLKSHPLAGPVTEAAERRPELFALSHNARGRERRGPSGTVVEAILSVVSVDIVCDGATCSSLRESRDQPGSAQARFLAECFGKPSSRLRENSTSQGPREDKPPTPVPIPDGTPDAEALRMLGAKAAEIVGDRTLDKKTKIESLKEVLDLVDRLLALAQKETGSKPTKEARQMRDHANRLLEQARRDARPLPQTQQEFLSLCFRR